MIVMVADSNALEHPGLEGYLQTSRNHLVAIPDLMMIEMHKRKALFTSRKSLAIVSRRINQVYLIKPPHSIVVEKIVNSDDATNLFDYRATAELAELCTELAKVPVPVGLEAHMEELELGAAQQMEMLREEVKEFGPALLDAARDFSGEELRLIRKRQPVGDEVRRKIFELLKDTTRDSIVRNQPPPRGYRLQMTDALGMFAFRYSLCTLIYYLMWIEDGGGNSKKLDTHVNDVIDLQVAALGSYFNGVLSRDKQVRNVSLAARAILRNYGAFVGTDWNGEVAVK